MASLTRFLEQLKSLPEEVPIQPELKPERKEHDRKLREEHDLQTGAVLEAIVEPGQGGPTPQDGDLVYVHYSVHTVDDDLIYSTRSDEGGSGQPLAFKLGKGWRAPRSWELSLAGMTQGQRKVLQVKPEYGYQHPDCKMTTPPGTPAKQPLKFDLELINWYPASEVRQYGEDDNVFKRTLTESDSWETATPPYQVMFTASASTPAYDGTQGTGYCYHKVPTTMLQLGQGLLPEGMELALTQMNAGETAVFVLPAGLMKPPHHAESKQVVWGEEVPAKAAQVELTVELHKLVQVRDMTGDGAVMKKRLKQGTGDFPNDCPLHDTTVRIHYRVRPLSAAPDSPWVYDSRQPSMSAPPSAATAVPSTSTTETGEAAEQSTSDSTVVPAPQGEISEAPPLEIDTGCGDLPEGLEMCLKLMIPGELSSALCQPRYAYQGRTDAPAGVHPDEGVEFEIELFSFEREGYWQNLEWEERYQLADRMKEKGNQLYRDKKYGFAIQRYQRLLHMLNSTRDYEEDDQVARIDDYKLAVLSNMALCAHQQGEYAKAVEWCDKALEMDPDNAKVVFRRGKALSMKGDYDDAEEEFSRALAMDASIATDVESGRAANKQRQKQAAQKQKQQFKNFFDR